MRFLKDRIAKVMGIAGLVPLVSYILMW